VSHTPATLQQIRQYGALIAVVGILSEVSLLPGVCVQIVQFELSQRCLPGLPVSIAPPLGPNRTADVAGYRADGESRQLPRLARICQ